MENILLACKIELYTDTKLGLILPIELCSPWLFSVADTICYIFAIMSIFANEQKTHNIVMRKLILFIAVALIQISLFSQQRGFFFTERDPTHYSSNGKFSVETYDGCYIVTEVSILPSDGQTQVDILKFSAEGELLNRAVVGRGFEIAGLFHASEERSPYYLILVKLDSHENLILGPRIVCFDDNLSICSSVDVELPPDILNGFVVSARAITDGNNKVYFSFSTLEEWITRIHTCFTLDGQFETFTIDNQSGFAGSLFMLPDGSCWSYINGVLSRFDDSLNLNSVHVFGKIAEEQISGDTLYQVWTNGATYPTVIALPDSSFVIAEEVVERWWNQNHDMIGADYGQTAFFISDFSGVVERAVVIGSRDTLERPALFQAIDYVSPQAIYLCGFQHLEPDSFGNLVIPNKILIKKVDDSFNLIWEKAYMLGASHYMPMYLLATRDGGCLVAGRIMYNINENESDLFVLKINADGTVGNDEILVEDILLYTIYPNPARNELHLKYSPDVQPAQVELYDLQGRLVRTHRSNLEHIDMSQLPTGTYTMRVIMEDGRAYSDKVVKE